MSIIDAVYFSGQNLYAHIRNKSGAIWNGSAFETYNASNYATYTVSLTEEGGSGYYSAPFPVAITAKAKFRYAAYARAGESPAQGDTPAGGGRIDWNVDQEDGSMREVMESLRLHHLLFATAGGSKPAINSIFDLIMNSNSLQAFDRTFHSLEVASSGGGGGGDATAIANAVWNRSIDTSFAADSAGERLKAIDDKLPSGTISGFNPASTGVNLNPDQSGATIGTVNSLSAGARAQVKTQIIDALSADVMAELAVGNLPTTPTVYQALMTLYMSLVNKQETSSIESYIFNRAGTAIAKASVSDDGSKFTKGVFISA